MKQAMFNILNMISAKTRHNVLLSPTSADINELKSLLQVYHIRNLDNYEYSRMCELFQLQKYNRSIG
jgi:protein-tyrosine phosphatase